jgi:hypothetical protein
MPTTEHFPLKVLYCHVVRYTVADPDPHHFWKLDTDPHQRKLDPDPDPHQS